MVFAVDRTEPITRSCRALAVDTRLGILAQLRSGPLCVGALAARLDVTQSAVSQHLRILKDAGFVSAERRGYFVHYRLNETAVRDWVKMLGEELLGSAGRGRSKATEKGGEKRCVRRKGNARSRRI